MNKPDTESFQGLPSTISNNQESLKKEEEWLEQQKSLPKIQRWKSFLIKGGPGYLQSALTLGGGTVTAMLFSGAAYGYQLLWVAPLSMLLGIIIFSAVSHQTLSTGQRPFIALKDHAGPFFAWAFSGGAVLSSIIWHFAQYSLGASVLVDLSDVAGMKIPSWVAGIIILAISIIWAVTYGTSNKMRDWFEKSLRILVWGIVACFGLVAFRTGIADPLDLISGFIPSIPESLSEVSSLTVIVGGLSASVGANMLFLYPYSLMAKGWSSSHKQLAQFDLISGMFIPYFLATTLMVIATANIFYYGDLEFTGRSLSPFEASQILESTIGPLTGRMIFNLGILGMAISSIILQMICCGFVALEVFGWEFGSLRYRLACLIPAPGVLGSVLWSDIALWAAVPTTVICGFFLPISYVGFIILQKSSKYLGSNKPKGLKANIWVGSMIVGTLILIIFLAWTLIDKVPKYLGNLF
tara:strand:- start:930 stop:2330 length:1401 start_codon:yes stop_codon:yes gene_type:complete